MQKKEIDTEKTSLEWKDINFEKGYIAINKTTQYINNKIIKKTPKNNSSIRTVSITQATLNSLMKYRENQELLKQKLGNKWIDSKKVFTTTEGGIMFPDTPSRILNMIIKKYNLPIILSCIKTYISFSINCFWNSYTGY